MPSNRQKQSGVGTNMLAVRSSLGLFIVAGIALSPAVKSFNPSQASPTFLVRGSFPEVCPKQSIPSPNYFRRGGSAVRRFFIDEALDTPSDAPPTPRSSRQVHRKIDVSTLHTLKEFNEFLRNENEKIVVVRFHAQWCRACKAVKVAYDRLAKANPGMKFVDVEISSKNEDLRAELDIPAVPFGHIYHPETGLVEAAPLDRSHLSEFKRIVKSYAAIPPTAK